ncbi:hypothetical protein LINPERHAP2_LOCUS6667 [Linum perenne]
MMSNGVDFALIFLTTEWRGELSMDSSRDSGKKTHTAAWLCTEMMHLNYLCSLHSCSSIPMNQSFEDATLEPQPFDPAANFANTEDSPLQELLLDSSDIWRKETLESCDDVRAFMTTPLIDMLPSGARVRELFLFQCFYLHIDVL